MVLFVIMLFGCTMWKMCFSPRGSVLSFEGGILLSISLGLAVRIFWSDLKKFPKSASGKILGRHFGLGAFLWRKMVPKKMFCGGMILWWGFKEIPPAQMNSMVPGSHMGRLLCPKPPFKKYFPGNFPKSGKLQVALGPYWGPRE